MGQNVARGLVRSTVSGALDVAVNGADPKEALKTAVVSGTVAGVASTAAGQIGLGKAEGHLGTVGHKVLHGLAGAAAGALSHRDAKLGALSGAIGAITAEIVAETMMPSSQEAIYEAAQERARSENRPMVEEDLAEVLNRRMELAGFSGKLGGAVATLVTGLDPQIGAQTAGRAVDNNFFPTLIPVAVMAGGALWTAHEVYEAYKEGGRDAALGVLAREGLLTIVGGVGAKTAFKVGGVVYNSTKAAWKAAVAKYPSLRVVGKLTRGGGKLNEGRLSDKKYLAEMDKFAKLEGLGKKASTPKSLAQKEAHGKFLRASMERPHAQDARLRKFLEDIYRIEAKEGSGSTAAALRHEIKTGNPVGGKFHEIKTGERIRNLEKWLKNNPNATASDRAAAENVLLDMKDALKMVD